MVEGPNIPDQIPAPMEGHTDYWMTLHAFSGAFRMATQLLAMMILVPIIIHYVGEEKYGIWTLAMALVGVLSFLEMGLVQASNRYLSEIDFLSNPQEMRELANVSFWLTMGSGLLVLLIGLPFSVEIAHLFEVPGHFTEEAGGVIAIFIWRLAISIPMRTFSTVLISQRKMARAHFTQGIANIIYFFLGLWALSSELGLMGLAYAYLGSMLLEHLLYVVMSRSVVPLGSYNPFRIKSSHVKRLSEFAVFAWLGQIVAVFLARSGVLLVQVTAGLVSTGAFGIASRLTSISAELSAQVIFAGGPTIAKLSANSKEGRKEAGWLTLALSRRAMLLSGPLAAVAIPLGGPFLKGWVGGDLATEAAGPLAVLASSVALGAPYMTASNALTLSGEHRWTNSVSILFLLAYIPLAYTGGNLWGPLGVALAGLFLNVTLMIPLFLNRISKRMDVPLRYWWSMVYRTHVLPFAVCVSIGFGLAELMQRFVPEGRLWMAAAAGFGLLSAFSYYFVFFKITALKEEREQIGNLMDRIRSFTKRS